MPYDYFVLLYFCRAEWEITFKPTNFSVTKTISNKMASVYYLIDDALHVASDLVDQYT